MNAVLNYIRIKEVMKETFYEVVVHAKNHETQSKVVRFAKKTLLESLSLTPFIVTTRVHLLLTLTQTTNLLRKGRCLLAAL